MQALVVRSVLMRGCLLDRLSTMRCSGVSLKLRHLRLAASCLEARAADRYNPTPIDLSFATGDLLHLDRVAESSTNLLELQAALLAHLATVVTLSFPLE